MDGDIMSKILIKKKETENISVSVRISEKLLAQYDDLSQKTGHSRHELMKRALAYWIELAESEE